jgi:SRSO17 transposase
VGSRLSAPGPQEKRFAAYVDGLATAAGHEDRHAPLKDYCKGLLLPGERKSIEPMAARLNPHHVQATRQSLHHLVAKAPWSDQALLDHVRQQVLSTMQKHGPVVAWIVDDTSFPKKGQHSVGVTRQYCGQVGKQEKCRIAVSLSLATWDASLPIAYRLYLPKDWAEDAERREKVEVPEEVKFQTKPEIALDQIRAAAAAQVARGVVLADRGLRHQHRVSRRTHSTGTAICSGGAKLTDSLGIRQTAFAGQATRKNGATAAVVAAERGPSAGLSKAVGDEPALQRVQRNHLA